MAAMCSAAAAAQRPLWDAATGRDVREFRGHTSAVLGVAFSPDGKQVVIGSGDGTAGCTMHKPPCKC